MNSPFLPFIILFFVINTSASFAQIAPTVEPPYEEVPPPPPVRPVKKYRSTSQPPPPPPPPGYRSNSKNGVKVFEENGRFGLKKEDKIVHPAVYKKIVTSTKSYVGINDAVIDIFSNELKLVKQVKVGVDDVKKIGDYYVLTKDGLHGLINKDGKEIYPTKYQKIYTYRGLLIIDNGTKKAIYSPAVDKSTAFIYDRVYMDGMTYITVTENGKKGILNRSLDVILPTKYESVMWHTTNGFVIEKDKKEGWADIEGNIIITPQYDELDDFSTLNHNDFTQFFKVQQDDKYGIIDYDGKIIIPVEYRFISTESNYFVVANNEKPRKLGVFSKQGKEVLPVEYSTIRKSATLKSELYQVKKDNLLTLTDSDFQALLPTQQKDINYLHNTTLLFNPFSVNGSAYLAITDSKNKVGVFEEHSKKLVIPQKYEAILQKFDTRTATYFLAKKKNKYGVLNENNEAVIPFKYDFIDIDHLIENLHETTADYKAVVEKNKKFGLVNFNGKVILPPTYEHLARISEDTELYKAKQNGFYQIINSKGKAIHPGPFDDIALFWKNEVLAFKDGNATIVNKDGSEQFTKKMEMHDGFKTFDELKFALIDALNGENEDLIAFAEKVAPSEHIQHFVLRHPYDRSQMYYDDRFYERAVEKYAKRLIDFKYWWIDDYDQSSLTDVNDYTFKEGNYIIVKRNRDWAYGDTRDLEKILRHCFRVNGYWVSGYFLSHRY